MVENSRPAPSVEAVEVLQTAVARAPRHPDAHAQLGVALARLGRRDEAVKEFRLALQLQPNHPVATSGLAGLQSR